MNIPGRLCRSYPLAERSGPGPRRKQGSRRLSQTREADAGSGTFPLKPGQVEFLDQAADHGHLILRKIENILPEIRVQLRFHPRQILANRAHTGGGTGKEVDIDEFIDLMNGKLTSIEAKGVKRNGDSTYTLEYRKVSKDDVAPHSSDYYKKALDMIKRYVNNQK